MSFKSMLNKNCALEFCVKQQDPSTGEEKYIWSSAYPSISCRLRGRTYAERVTSELEYQHSTYALYIEYMDIDPKKTRVIIDGVYYKVSGVIDLGGGEEYLCVYLERWV